MGEELNEKLIKSIKNKDYESFDKALKELATNSKKLKFFEFTNYINNIDFTKEERIEFYMLASSRCKDSISKTFRLEIIPYSYELYIMDNKEYFCNLLKNNKEILDEYIEWFKKYPNIAFSNNIIDIYPIVFNIEEFKNKVLTDNKFISKNFAYDEDFFRVLPNEFGYLISLYNPSKDKNGKILKELYDTKITNKLNKIDKLELIDTQVSINAEPNIFEMSTYDRMLEFEYCLKRITEDTTYFQMIKDIMKKTGLNMKTIMKFASKYDNNEIFKNVCKNKTISPETIEKIKYLSNEEKLKDSSLLDKIDKINLEELKKLEKEKNKDIEINIHGGPQSKTNERFFENEYNREIIRINLDGSINLKPVKIMENHEDIVKKIYSEIDFPEDCNNAIARAVYAANQLSAVTLIIEMEMGYFIIPNTLEQEQLNSICNMLDKANKNALIGVINNKNEIAFNGECVSSDVMKDYILKTIKINQVNKIK